MVRIPPDLDNVIEEAWQKTRRVPGFLGENEARFLGLLAACVPAEGAIVEIGSYKGKSTVMLASVAAHYGRGPVVAIDPHTGPSPTDRVLKVTTTTFDEFQASLKSAGVEKQVEAHREFSGVVARDWKRPIRLLWIDGDHTYRGAKEDFDLFTAHLVKGGVVAIHQFCRIGKMSMIGGCSKVVQDVPPFMLADGNPAETRTVNKVGMERNGVSEEAQAALRQAFKILFREGLTIPNALSRIEKELPALAELRHLVEFVRTSERGISK